MPRKGLEMSSPRIVHLRVRFVDLERPKVSEPHKRAGIVVAPDRPSEGAIRRPGKT